MVAEEEMELWSLNDHSHIVPQLYGCRVESDPRNPRGSVTILRCN